MNLLTKLDAVEIKADNRISESDRAFCQMRQEAYDEARKILVELRQQWKGTLRQQEEKYGKEHYVALEGFSTFTIQQKISNLPSRLDKAACKESAEQIKSILFRT